MEIYEVYGEPYKNDNGLFEIRMKYTEVDEGGEKNMNYGTLSYEDINLLYEVKKYFRQNVKPITDKEFMDMIDDFRQRKIN